VYFTYALYVSLSLCLFHSLYLSIASLSLSLSLTRTVCLSHFSLSEWAEPMKQHRQSELKRNEVRKSACLIMWERRKKTHTHTLSLSLSHTLSLSHLNSHALYLHHTQTHTLSHTLYVSLCLLHTHYFTLYLSRTHILSHSLSQEHTNLLSLSHKSACCLIMWERENKKSLFTFLFLFKVSDRSTCQS